MNHPLIVKVRYGLVALTTTWFLSALVSLSDAGLNLLASVIHFCAAVALAAGWVFCLITSRKGSHSRSALISLITLPAATLIVYAVAPPPNLLFRLRFLASRPTLAATADAALVAPPADLQHVALFAIDHVEIYDGQVLFITTACGLTDQCGIAYSPTRTPRSNDRNRFASLGGPWYHVHQRF